MIHSTIVSQQSRLCFSSSNIRQPVQQQTLFLWQNTCLYMTVINSLVSVSVPVTSVTITSPATNPVPVTEHQPTLFTCTTSAERPRSTIKWHFRNDSNPLPGGTISPADNDTLVSTVGTLVHRFDRSENGNVLYCTAVNIDGRTPVESTNSKQISVQCKYKNNRLIWIIHSFSESVLSSHVSEYSCYSEQQSSGKMQHW